MFPTRDAIGAIRRVAAAPWLPAVGAALLATAGLAQVLVHPGRPATDLIAGLVLALCTTAPVAFVRSHPLPAAAAGTVAVLLTLGLGHPPTLGGLVAQAIVLYFVGAHHAYTAVLFAVPYVAYAVGPAESRAGGKVLGVALLVVAGGALAVGGVRRARAEAVDHTTADSARADLGHAYAAREERARIARELHDIVAHHISSVSVQAETVRLTTPGLSADAAARVLAIGETARLALTEMRRLLGVLRDDAGPDEADLPQPGLQDLVTLVDEARDRLGTRVRLIVSGPVRRLEPGLELTAYRVAQEALTNSRRHAPGAAVDIELRYREHSLLVSVWDAGGAAGPPSEGGHGLLGMWERVAMAGGTLHTGRGPVGGFVVQAVLPVPGGAR
ncbi:sensor histidine kinase [Dactylosporangium darangshiense]|uniref:sensor histidine kinase n=1 Tax=Dactylosporangium darangshiense TaxID=579108 RepID=UPI0031E6E340